MNRSLLLLCFITIIEKGTNSKESAITYYTRRLGANVIYLSEKLVIISIMVEPMSLYPRVLVSDSTDVLGSGGIIKPALAGTISTLDAGYFNYASIAGAVQRQDRTQWWFEFPEGHKRNDLFMLSRDFDILEET